MRHLLPCLSLVLGVLVAGIASDAVVPASVAADCGSQPAPPDRVGVGYRGTVTGVEEVGSGRFAVTLSVDRTLAGPARRNVIFETGDSPDCNMVDGSAIDEGDELVLVGTEWWRPRRLAYPFAWRAADGERWDLSVIAPTNRHRLPAELRRADTYPEILAFIGAGLPPTDEDAASSPAPAVSDGAEDGLFRLTVVAPSAVVEVGDAIPITTTLTYVGPTADLAVRHLGDQVVQYRIERLAGGFTGETNPGPECSEATFRAGEVRAVTFGQADPGSPDASVWSRWVDDRLAELGPGTYRLTATVGYGLFRCERRRSISASIEFEVIDRDRSPDASPEPVPIPTGLPAPTDGPVVCMTAELDGHLISDGRWGLAVGPALSAWTVKVIWPAGWSAQRDASGLVLIDSDGVVVAREGDHVLLGGGEDPLGDWRTCDDLHLVVLPD